jgi:electron transfer flavoprotein alpha subunit
VRLGLRRLAQNQASIQEADKLVAGGRGLKKGQNFALIRNLAAKLGAGIGASRDAVDRGWISYPHQVGLTGKTVTPRLYLALGISGSIQHLAGMKTAQTIVAVNTDPNAQIFQVADFGVVGDLFEFVPALTEEIERRKARKGPR